MTPDIVTIAILVAATLFGAWRTARSRTAGRVARIVLQMVVAVLFALVLWPPARTGGGEVLRVLTPGSTPEQRAPIASAVATVALPGVDAAAGVERVPDLGTALRRHPRVDRIEVIGGGLPARDRDAARAVALQFSEAPLPAGVTELRWPDRIDAGTLWRLSGRVAGVDAGVRVELHDRSGARIGSATPQADGAFAIDARAKAAGAADYVLRVVDSADRVVETVPVGVVVRAGERLRVLVLAGALDAESKYLRRWASDAGIDLRARLAISRGVSVRDGEVTLDAAGLGESDLVIVDERSWSALARADKERLLAAVDDGLGLLLRITGPVPPAVAREWDALGWRLRAADRPQRIALAAQAGSDAAAPDVDQRPLEVTGDAAVALVGAADGTPLAAWRAQGRGRTGVWWLGDTFPLVLRGDAARFGMLWREAVVTLGRARGEAAAAIPHDLRVDQRGTLCGLGGDSAVEAPDGLRTVLAIDPATPGCAAYWPRQRGWHALVDGDVRTPFRVQGADEAIAIERTATAAATRALVKSPDADALAHAVPGPRWPWFLAWIGACALLWWRERRVLSSTRPAVPDRARP